MLCYVYTVNRVVFEAFTQMHTDTFLSITLLILNRFSILKKFWKAENQGFPTMPNNMHTCQYCWYRHKISNAFSAMDVDSRYKHVHTFLSITLLIFNGFSIWKKFWKAENQGFPTMSNMHTCPYCRYRHKISNAFSAMDVNTVNTNNKKDNILD